MNCCLVQVWIDIKYTFSCWIDYKRIFLMFNVIISSWLLQEVVYCKGTVSRDLFRIFYFMNRFHLGPLIKADIVLQIMFFFGEFGKTPLWLAPNVRRLSPCQPTQRGVRKWPFFENPKLTNTALSQTPRWLSQRRVRLSMTNTARSFLIVKFIFADLSLPLKGKTDS